MAILPLVMRQAPGPAGLLWIDASPSIAVQRFLDGVREEAGSMHVARDRARRAKSRR